LLDNKKLISELSSLERRTGRSGRDSIDHPPGGHDDMANAAAGALVRALGSSNCYGLLDYFAGIQAGTIPMPLPGEQGDVQRTIQQDIARWERRGMELRTGNSAKFQPESLPPCEKCGSNLVQRIATTLRCGQCGHQTCQGSFVVAGRGPGGRPVLREVNWPDR
jgi:ribosomal protein L37AE/L43A